MPAISDLLDLSTAHLPTGLADDLSLTPGVRGNATATGWLMRVPHELADSAAAAPEAIVAIWRHARALGCDLVLFNDDADRVDGLPTWRP